MQKNLIYIQIIPDPLSGFGNGLLAFAKSSGLYETILDADNFSEEALFDMAIKLINESPHTDIVFHHCSGESSKLVRFMNKLIRLQSTITVYLIGEDPVIEKMMGQLPTFSKITREDFIKSVD